MAKLKITAAFRARISDKLMDLGNLIWITMAISQFISGKEFVVGVFIGGFILTLFCYIISYIISN